MTKASAFGKRNYTSPETDRIISEGGSKFTGKVFLYMFIALAITAAVCGFCGYLISQLLNNGSETAGSTFSTLLVVSIIAYIPILIWTQISVLRGGKGLTPAFVIYSAIMGVLMSLFTAVLPFYVIAISFGLTCGAFGLMALIAWTSKKNLSNLAVMGMGILFGVLLISLFGFILSLMGFDSAAIMLDMIVSAGIFLFVILVTISDLFNIRQIAARGEGSQNLAMVCAFSLYVDFIYIFIRILSVVVRIMAIFGNRR